MESIPKIENSLLSPEEKALYLKFVAKNPGMTESDFSELRKDALNSKVQKFYEYSGILMQEVPDRDDQKELRGDN